MGAVGAPIAVDLYAPRVMEAAFDGALRSTSIDTLRAPRSARLPEKACVANTVNCGHIGIATR